MLGRVIHIISGDVWGGKEVQLSLQLPALRALGWDASVLLFHSGETEKRLVEANIPCQSAEEKQGFWPLVRECRETIKAAPPDILHAHSYKESVVGYLLAWSLGISLVCTFHGLPERHFGLRSLKMKAYHLLHSFVARYLARRVITVSKSLAQALGYENVKTLEVIYNVTDPGGSTPPANPLASALAQTRLAIAWVGRLTPIKRCDLAILTMNELVSGAYLPGTDQPHLYIIGDGPLRMSLLDLASHYGLQRNVHVVGYVAHANQLISEATILLITSDSEGIPTVLLEAIAAGVPVVSTDLPGIREALRLCPTHPAYYAELGNPKALAKQVREALLQARTRGPSQPRQGNLAKEFLPAHAARSHDRLYKEVLGKSDIGTEQEKIKAFGDVQKRHQ